VWWLEGATVALGGEVWVRIAVGLGGEVWVRIAVGLGGEVWVRIAVGRLCRPRDAPSPLPPHQCNPLGSRLVLAHVCCLVVCVCV
jgi:hypothetical protein